MAAAYAGVSRAIYLQDIGILILDNLRQLLRSSAPRTVDLSESLVRYESYLRPVVSADTIRSLMETDPDSLVAKVRRVGEYLAKTLARQHLSEYRGDWTFEKMTRTLYERKVISAKAKGYIDAVRVLGNIASHADESVAAPFSRDEALVICNALLLFLRDVIDGGLL